MLKKLRATSIAVLAFAMAATGATSSATPGSGFAPSVVVNGHFDSLSQMTDKTGKWDLSIKSKGDTDVGTDWLSIAAGGYSGWHTHPAPVFVTVTSGSIVWYDGSNPICAPHTYSAGESFVEPAGRNHYVRNASTSATAEYVAIRMNPTGVPFRQDAPKPSGCDF